MKPEPKRYLAEIHAHAKKHGGECLSDNYINAKTKMPFRCAHGHIWQTTPNSIRISKTWCPICRYDKRKRSLADLHKIAVTKGGKCLATHYVSMNEKIQWQCKKGHIWKTAACKVKLGTWCRECANAKLRANIEEMQLLAQSHGGKCLSTQ